MHYATTVPTVRDRVVQMATLLILEPIFAADFLDCSYGFRPGRSAHQALEAIRGHLQAGYQAVYDADLKGYFDSIPHSQLLACVRMRVVDRAVLRLIRMWLEAPVVERSENRVVDLREEGASLNFLGYTFRYDRDRKGRDQKYLNMFPSAKAVQKEREKLHAMTNSHQCFKPIPVLIGELNRHRRGWVNYFSIGYPTSVYCEIDRYVQGRLIQHWQRRSQRPYRPPQGESWLGHLARLGLHRLSELVHA